MQLENLNFAIFSVLNASAQPAWWMVSGAVFWAKWVVFITVAWMVFAWIRNGREFRFVLLDTFLTAVIALSFNQVIASLFYHARPFELKLGQQFLDHATESSFPSDHGGFMFAVAITLLIYPITRKWGRVFLALGIGVAWSRVYLGVHFPFDMVGAFGVAFISAVIVEQARPNLRQKLYPVPVDLYDKIICLLKLPPVVFPRAA